MEWKTSDNIIGTNFIVNAPIFLAVLTKNVEIGFLSRSTISICQGKVLHCLGPWSFVCDRLVPFYTLSNFPQKSGV